MSVSKLVFSLILIAVFLCSAGLSGCGGAYPSGGAAPSSQQCRENPLAGVYHAYRLEVREACKTVAGTVERVKDEQDGDLHINLRLDGQDQKLLNAKNRSLEHGDLVVEVIPIDARHVPLPKTGDRITVTGAYVLDKDHGWMEIHPAWLINGQGSTGYDAKLAHTYEQGNPNDWKDHPED